MPTIDFYRLRFHFQALDPVCFPAAGSANLVRGACGLFLRQVAPPEIYARLFEPGRHLGPAPSGLADWPRPFVFRTARLDGVTAEARVFFSFDLHLFDLQQPVLPHLQAAFAAWAASGIGPGRRRARLERIEPLTLEGCPAGATPCSLPLDGQTSSVDRVTVRFVTPTELKAAGQIAERPEFPVLFARLRDRICTLHTLFGQGTLELDFLGMNARAAAIRLVRSDLAWQHAARTSRRTGQTHPLGGFTGEAEYQGVLTEFMPWLRAARWAGVGRQTVWGKGEMHLVGEASACYT